MQKWDITLISALVIVMVVGYVVACLNVRSGWSPKLPLAVQLICLVVAVYGYDGLMMWAMVSNAFFMAMVRTQSDRHQTVTTSGPYRFVRHPGYLGGLLSYLGTPLLLNSLWAFIPAAGTTVLITRTALEDKMLQAELPGYQEYTGQVRYRLLPGVW
jgi:protein-S-isoprenylcysteine O-methyltransferase Ste14